MHTCWNSLRRNVHRRPWRPAQRATVLFAAAAFALILGSAAAADLPAGGHVWVLGVNTSLSTRDPGSLKSTAQAPDTGALAVSGNRKRLFGMESAIGRAFEIDIKKLTSTPVVELKQPLSGICANP